MDYRPWLILVGVVVAFLLLKRIGQISPAAARQWLKQGALVLDVRTEGEYEAGHVPGAVNIPVDRLGTEITLRVPDKEQPLLLHCLSGTRSGMGKSLLKKMGYRNVFNLGSYARAAKIVGGAAPSQEKP